VKLGPVFELESVRHVLEVKGLTVSPAHRRRGVGRALLAAAIREATDAGARRLTLRVLGHNADARSLYAACGFEVEGVLREFFYLDGRYVDDVLMTRPLTAGG
jgi:ribosomal protein S18 acetylase RimI-like enzyme